MFLKISNLCGSDQAFWTIQSNACEVLIPNVFTPNGGNGNDSFVIKGLENYSGSKLQIFNRWGNLVFESDNYRNDWRGQDVEDGTYWYLLTLPYGVKTDHKGFIEVLR
jgi:gliding motility-associated-like protein